MLKIVLTFHNCDIFSFPRLKAIGRALDNDGLPANVVYSMLDGFSRASNTRFKELCITLRSLHSSSMHNAMIGRMTAKQLCFLILGDLETNFNDQTAGKKWNFGHEGAAFRATYNTYLQSNVAGMVPYKEWIEKRKCFNCGETGHIAPNCPKPPNERNQKMYGGRGRGASQGRGRGRGASDGGRGRGRDRYGSRGRGKHTVPNALIKHLQLH